MKVAVEGRLKVLEESLELVQMLVKSWHILNKEITKLVLVHQLHEKAECFFFWHLFEIVRIQPHTEAVDERGLH